MILLFPDLSTLQLALGAGLLPERIAAAPAEFATGDDGRVWVKSAGELESTERSALKPLGISLRKSTRGAASALQPVMCWPQILPLEKRSAGRVDEDILGERSPVLFELPESAQLAEMVTEMLRLGNDRQKFRPIQTPAGEGMLLLVKGPPYYTLLRSIDRLDGPATPRAYVEHHPRVWAELGYDHPLAEQIQPPPGLILLLNAPRDWTAIKDEPFRDIYEALRFTLPHRPENLEAPAWDERLKVPLRLVRGGHDEPPELWVLTAKGIRQLEDLVQASDDRLISRLAFAVGTSAASETEETVVVKVRPGKEPPPVLVLDGQACRSYLRIPNLFLPVGHRLHPPLRRDAVKQLLANDPNLDTWLVPKAEGRFIPQSLPDNAFRPLSDWVEYVLDKERDALTMWMEAARFDFESFVCPDEEPDRSVKSRQHPRENDRERKPAEASPERSRSGKYQPPKKPGKKTPQAEQSKPRTSPRRTAAAEPAVSSELQQHLQALESQFREMSAPADAPERLALWRELAETQMALGGQQKVDGAICYVQGLWEQFPLPADWVQDWFEAEVEGRDIAPMSGDRFLKALAAKNPSPAQLHALAVHVIAAAFGESGPSAPPPEHLSRLQRQLEAFDVFLPLRTAWLCWLSSAKLAHDDVLTLARTRDRFLERLYQQGLSPDLDVPGFLRSSGARTGERFRTIQEHLRALRERAHTWIKDELDRSGSVSRGQTAAYADLILAYGYARVGLAEECGPLVAQTRKRLSDAQARHVVHDWLFDAFQYRIERALQGKSQTGPLPDELMKVISEKQIEPSLIFIIDSLRGKSRILQPYEQVGGHTRFLASVSENYSSLASQVEHLSDCENQVELANQIRSLLEEHGGEQSLASAPADRPLPLRPASRTEPMNYQVLLSALLSFAPRLGEAHAKELLNQVSPTLDLLSDPCQQAVLLDRALFVAAHFGHATFIRQFFERLHGLLESAQSPETVRVLGMLLGQSFRGLRKLGMRGEISQLLEQMGDAIESGRFDFSSPPSPAGKKPKSIRKPQACAERDRHQMEVMLLRLNLAAGWFFFGNLERANTIIEEVAQFLYRDSELIPQQKRMFVRQYAAVLEHAPIDVAISRWNEVFDKLTHITKGIAVGIQDQYYVLEPLEVLEAVVLAMVSDEFTLDPKSRKLMEEYELSIRRRIHRDLEHLREACPT